MRLIIAGSRHFADAERLRIEIEASEFEPSEVVSGGAAGVDSLGEQWAALRGVPVRRFPADWGQHGASAGPRRNQQMADYAAQCPDGGGCVVLHDGGPGSADMMRRDRAAGLRAWFVDVRRG